jgi:hypothetical protein
MENLKTHSHTTKFCMSTLHLSTGKIGPECKMIREFEKVDKKHLEAEALKINWCESDQATLDERMANFNYKLIGLFLT